MHARATGWNAHERRRTMRRVREMLSANGPTDRPTDTANDSTLTVCCLRARLGWLRAVAVCRIGKRVCANMCERAACARASRAVLPKHCAEFWLDLGNEHNWDVGQTDII